MKRAITALIAVLGLFFADSVEAQSGLMFGKNAVNWQNEKPKFYQSEHFDVYYFGFDLTVPEQEKHFKDFIGNIEGGYRFIRDKFNHDIERRIPVAVYATHSQFETGAAYVTGEFLSEGTGAFVDSIRRRMYTKQDILPPIRREANVHELVHEFQFDMLNVGIISQVAGLIRLPLGLFEGGAEFVAGLYEPLSLDNVRRTDQRMAASNRKTIPTWFQLINDQVNPYTMWTMVFQMIEDKYGKGIEFQVEGLKSGSAEGLGELIYHLSKGELGNPIVNPEKFDQQARDYWYKIYGKEGGERPRPYQETDSVKSRSVTPYENPYPMFLACQFPDGKRLAAFTIYKGMPALVTYPVPEEILYAKEIKFDIAKDKKENNKNGEKPKKVIKNLTPQMPPIPWEYLIIQGFETWPFNGSDAGCSSDGKQIVFFARKNRDHTLFVIDAETGKIIKQIEFESPLPQLDQAFSPVFSPDGKTVYFSAAKHVTRDIYSIELEKGKVTNLTDDSRFNTAPSVSPDGGKIAYIGQDGDFQHLFVLDITVGTKSQITFGRFNDAFPSWSEDGNSLIYVSDAWDNIWNIYTIDLKTKISSQWTEFSGQVLNPIFVKGHPDKIYFAVYWDEDEYGPYVYPNYEIYEATLKQPIRQTVFADYGETTEFSFQPYRSLFNYELDTNQLANKAEPPENWHIAGGDVYLGSNTYFGIFGSSYLEANNMLQTKRHLFRFILYGDIFKMLDYSYINQEGRWARAYSVSFQKAPLYYFYYDVIKRYPKQMVLNYTLLTETSVGALSFYPLDKYNRWEMYSKVRRRSFNLFGMTSELLETMDEMFPGYISNTDIGLSRFLERSSGSSVAFGGAYVRDTVMYSGSTQGPYHGNALRVQLEVAPPAGKVLDGYTSFGINARTYRRLTSDVLFAGRVDFLENTRANGDFLLLCGPDMLRGCPYGSMVGNRVAYASAEIRFPVLDALVFPRGIAMGPLRGLLFADAGIARFSGEDFAAQKGTSMGAGIQFLPFNVLWTRRSNGKWVPTFYVSYNW